AESLGRARPDRSHLRQLAACSARQLLGTVRARDDHPLVALDVDWLLERLDLDQRALDDFVPELLEPRGERARLLTRARDDDSHDGASARSSSASATGSSPVRRSIQAPSGSATSAVSVRPSWWAAIGARQPPPIAATQARSAPTRRCVSGSSASATSSSSPARTWSASAP